ncbi:terminase small subunit [Paenibacillus thiaminolyticus]|nr:terminase small subunit [Paenibacillus thiaminolyticus]NGP60110.1 terminase small subunit [Paenibacillus thiaminolyticus]
MEYLRDFNATRAAIAAGYSKKTAHVIGWENLRKPNIQAEIKRQKDAMVEELGVGVQRIIAEYMKIALRTSLNTLSSDNKTFLCSPKTGSQSMTRKLASR